MAEFFARLKGWRTVIVNGISATIIVLAEIFSWLAGFSGWSSIFSDPKVVAFIILGVNILNIALRIATTGPIGRSY